MKRSIDTQNAPWYIKTTYYSTFSVDPTPAELIDTLCSQGHQAEATWYIANSVEAYARSVLIIDLLKALREKLIRMLRNTTSDYNKLINTFEIITEKLTNIEQTLRHTTPFTAYKIVLNNLDGDTVQTILHRTIEMEV